MPTFGQRFKMLRTEKEMKQEELINDFNKKYHFGFTKAAISQYENDKRIPEIEALKAFSDYFNVSIDYLLGKSDFRSHNKRKFITDNLLLIKGQLSWEELSKDILSKLDNPLFANLFSAKNLEDISKDKKTLEEYSHIDLLAIYAGVEHDFFYRHNSQKDYTKAKKDFEYKNQKGSILHISDEMMSFINDPENLKYLEFAKNLKQKGINPELIVGFNLKYE